MPDSSKSNGQTKGYNNGWFAKRRLKRLIGEFTSLAKNIAADAEIIDILIRGYEELEAGIDIVVPDEKEEVSEAWSQLRDQALENEGLYIGLGITERSHYEAVQAKLSTTV